MCLEHKIVRIYKNYIDIYCIQSNVPGVQTYQIDFNNFELKIVTNKYTTYPSAGSTWFTQLASKVFALDEL